MNLANVTKTILLGLVLMSLTACHTFGGGVFIGGSYGYEGHHHGHMHSYWYYPDVDVYFDSGAGMYFYYQGTRWYSVRSLPRHYSGRLGQRVVIQTEEGSKPYMHHDQHRSQYRRDKMKSRDDKEERDEGHHGKGRGK